MDNDMNKFRDALKRLGSRDRPAAALSTSVLIALVVVLNVLIFALTSAFGLYIYSPDVTDLTISGNTDNLFLNVPSGREVTITFCMEEEALKSHSTGSYVWKTAKQFEERYSFIRIKYVNMLTKRDENGEIFNFEKYKTDMRGNETPIRQNTVIFSSGDSYRVITDSYSSAGFADFFSLDSSGAAFAYVGERIIAGMISWVLNDEHGTAYFTQKHGETADVSFANILTCAGYYVDVINLRDEEIPSDCDLVVISNPTSDFYRLADVAVGRSEIERLEDYLLRGGNLYVTLDPHVKSLPVLEDFLKEWGVELITHTNDKGVPSRALVRDNSLGISTDGYAFVAEYADSIGAGNVKTLATGYSDGGVLLADTGALKLDNSLGAYPLLTSSPSANLAASGEVIDSDGTYAVASYTERKNENGTLARVVVIPTIYLTAQDALISEGYTNTDFLYSVFYALFNAKSAPLGCKTVTYNTTVLENLTMQNARIYTALVMALPVALGIVGTVIIVRRRNR